MTKTLQDLLLQAVAKHGNVSGRALADLTEGREHTIDRTQVNALIKGTYKSELRPKTIRAIAWLAGVTEEVAFEAAGVPIPGPPFAQELPPSVDYLGPTSRSAVISIIRALLRAEAEGGEGREHGSAPMNDPGDDGGTSATVTSLNPPPPPGVPSADDMDKGLEDVEDEDQDQGVLDPTAQKAAREVTDPPPK